MLKSILIVTITVGQLATIEKNYDEYLGYETVERGTVSAELAAVWNTPATKGQPFVLLAPESGAEVYLRFVEGPEVEGYAPMTTFGWNATELLVTDPDAMAERLENSPYEIIGPPKDLWVAPDAPRAMQAIGPGNELLYLTRNNNFEIKTAVDRVFIMVVGGPSMEALASYYGDTMGLPVGDPRPFQISVISNAQGLPPETTYPLAVAAVSDEFLIELDEYPDVATPRPAAAGALPPGTAMVSFTVDRLEAFTVEWRSAPQAVAAAPYRGRRAAVTVGPAGEWIELIETPADTK